MANSSADFPSEKDLKNKKTPKESKKKQADKHESESSQNDSALSKVQAEVVALKKKNDELDDRYLRAEAEMQNLRNRQKKEIANFYKYEGQKLAGEILPALDNLQRALSVNADDEASKQLKKGVEMTLKALLKAINDQGITEIEATNQKFDPTLHQAVSTVPADKDHPAEQIVQVLQPGYIYKDRVLRPAMVVVAQ